MTVRIVTDSGADIPPADAQGLGITVVPLYVRFGEKVYRDGVDITADEFYTRLVKESATPFTSSPPPGDFIQAYRELATSTDTILSVHVTAKHSATCGTARLAAQSAERPGCHIEILDSQGVTAWQGLVVMAAARVAQAGGTLQQVMDKAQETIGRLKGVAVLDTLSYVARGGRLKWALTTLGSVLSVKPIITLHNGEVRPLGLARNKRKGMERLLNVVKSSDKWQELSVVYSSTAEEAHHLAEQIHAIIPHIKPRIDRFGPALGVHAGPGALAVVGH
uniref:Protein DegV n=1 Tax=uncultured Dehalococcoidia bacterium TaxID=498747 RepID=A0A871XZ81_9CHLR|nr:Protein DegV [uncultured Dehalococcoidia bacterium]